MPGFPLVHLQVFTSGDLIWFFKVPSSMAGTLSSYFALESYKRASIFCCPHHQIRHSSAFLPPWSILSNWISTWKCWFHSVFGAHSNRLLRYLDDMISEYYCTGYFKRSQCFPWWKSLSYMMTYFMGWSPLEHIKVVYFYFISEDERNHHMTTQWPLRWMAMQYGFTRSSILTEVRHTLYAIPVCKSWDEFLCDK